MAAAFDAVTTTGPTTTSPASWTHTPVGTPTLVLVWVKTDAAVLGTLGTVTYGGISMGAAVGSQSSADSNARITLYKLVNPPAGNQTVSVPWTGTSSIIGTAETFTGSDTTTPLGTFVSGTGTSDPVTITVAGAVNDVMCDGGCPETGNTLTKGAQQTQRWQVSDPGAGRSVGSTAPGVASQAMTWTGLVAGDPWTTAGVAVKAAAGGAGPFRSILGRPFPFRPGSPR